MWVQVWVQVQVREREQKLDFLHLPTSSSLLRVWFFKMITSFCIPLHFIADKVDKC